MPTATYIALANVTLAATDTEVVFSSIPNSYRDLVLVGADIGTSAANPALRLNADTGSNYSSVFMAATQVDGAYSSSGTTTSMIINQGATRTTSIRFIAHIMDYSATDKHKTVLIRSSASSGANLNDPVQAQASRWADTTAVDTVRITVSSGNIAIGSTFALYGIVS